MLKVVNSVLAITCIVYGSWVYKTKYYTPSYSSYCEEDLKQNLTYGYKNISFKKIDVCGNDIDGQFYYGSAELQNAYGVWRKADFRCIIVENKGKIYPFVEEQPHEYNSLMDNLDAKLKASFCNLIKATKGLKGTFSTLNQQSAATVEYEGAIKGLKNTLEVSSWK